MLCNQQRKKERWSESSAICVLCRVIGNNLFPIDAVYRNVLHATCCMSSWIMGLCYFKVVGLKVIIVVVREKWSCCTDVVVEKSYVVACPVHVTVENMLRYEVVGNVQRTQYCEWSLCLQIEDHCNDQHISKRAKTVQGTLLLIDRSFWGSTWVYKSFTHILGKFKAVLEMVRLMSLWIGPLWDFASELLGSHCCEVSFKDYTLECIGRSCRQRSVKDSS